MNTRSKTRLLQENNSDTNIEYDENQRLIIKRYENTIAELKADVIKKDNLLKIMTEEQSCNIVEFEKLCVENISIKKKNAENENC